MIRKACAVGVLVLGLLSVPATAHEDEGAASADGLVYHNCHELLGFQKAPPEKVRPFVPHPYGLDPDGDGDAFFYVSTRFCERITVGGVEVPNAIDSHISVFVDPPKSQSPPPHPSSLIVPEVPLEVYLLQWVTNNQAHASWLKQGTGLGQKVKLVPNLVYKYNPEPGHDHVVPGAVDTQFELEVPSPAPSPFLIDAEVHEPTGSIPASTIAENWWAETDKGTVIIHAEALRGASSLSAPARAKGTITAEDPSSPLGKIFGEPYERPLCSGPNGEPDLTCREGDPVGSSFLTGVQLTKCVRTTAGSCTGENH